MRLSLLRAASCGLRAGLVLFLLLYLLILIPVFYQLILEETP